MTRGATAVAINYICIYVVCIESKNLKIQPANALAAAQLHKLKSETQILIKKNPWTGKRWHEPSLEYSSALSSSSLSLSLSNPAPFLFWLVSNEGCRQQRRTAAYGAVLRAAILFSNSCERVCASV